MPRVSNKERKEITKAVVKTASKSSKPRRERPPSYSEATGNFGTSRASLIANPYLQSVLDPFNVHGCKIPDLIMYPSVPFTVVDRRTITVNANGIGFVTYGAGGKQTEVFPGALIPIKQSLLTRSYIMGSQNNLGAASLDLFPTFQPADQFTLSQWNETDNAIPTTFQRCRLVSAGVAINFTGTALNSKGKLTLAFAPRNSLRAEIANGPVSIDRISKIPGARVIPINELKGGTVLYKPLDNISLDYVNIADNVYDTTQSDFWSNNLSLAAAAGGEMFLIADGCQSGDSFQVTAVFNYEALPRLSTFNLANATPSPSDPIALSHAVNVLQSTPTTVGDTSHMEGLKRGDKEIKMPAINSTAVKTMTPHAGQQKSSMFDKILNFIGKVEGGIGKAMNVVSKAAPLASTIMSLL